MKIHSVRRQAACHAFRKLRLFTKILPARAAVTALTAGPAQPGNANAGARLEAIGAWADFDDPADDLVTKDEREFRARETAFHDLEVRPANGAGTNSNQNLALARAGLRDRPFAQRSS